MQIRDAALGLEYLHDQGVIHSDMKSVRCLFPSFLELASHSHQGQHLHHIYTEGGYWRLWVFANGRRHQPVIRRSDHDDEGCSRILVS